MNNIRCLRGFVVLAVIASMFWISSSYAAYWSFNGSYVSYPELDTDEDPDSYTDGFAWDYYTNGDGEVDCGSTYLDVYSYWLEGETNINDLWARGWSWDDDYYINGTIGTEHISAMNWIAAQSSWEWVGEGSESKGLTVDAEISFGVDCSAYGQIVSMPSVVWCEDCVTQAECHSGAFVEGSFCVDGPYVLAAKSIMPWVEGGIQVDCEYDGENSYSGGISHGVSTWPSGWSGTQQSNQSYYRPGTYDDYNISYTFHCSHSGTYNITPTTNWVTADAGFIAESVATGGIDFGSGEYEGLGAVNCHSGFNVHDDSYVTLSFSGNIQ